MVLIDSDLKPVAAREFLAELITFNTKSEISLRPGYSPVVNTLTSR